MTEVWKSVLGYEGSYEVSDLGRVRSLDRVLTDGHRRKGEMRKLQVSCGKCDYWEVMLSVGNKLKLRKVHALMLEAFVGPRPDGYEGCHRDGDSLNNSLSNLYWGTPKQNSADKERHGTMLRGERHWNAKLTAVDAERIRDLRLFGYEYAHIGDHIGASDRTVGKICRGERWTA